MAAHKCNFQRKHFCTAHWHGSTSKNIHSITSSITEARKPFRCLLSGKQLVYVCIQRRVHCNRRRLHVPEISCVCCWSWSHPMCNSIKLYDYWLHYRRMYWKIGIYSAKSVPFGFDQHTSYFAVESVRKQSGQPLISIWSDITYKTFRSNAVPYIRIQANQSKCWADWLPSLHAHYHYLLKPHRLNIGYISVVESTLISVTAAYQFFICKNWNPVCGSNSRWNKPNARMPPSPPATESFIHLGITQIRY